MKSIYIVLLVLVVAASASGCVDNKQGDMQTKTSIQIPGTTAEKPMPSPVEKYNSSIAERPVSTPAKTPASNDDQFGTEADLTAIESLVNDSNMDISLSQEI